jgi:hypothetical protein
MSEFSESYHLRTERAKEAVELLRRAERKGFVFEPVNGWVTFVAQEGTFEPDERIVAAANQPLLHYVSAEDHGWSFTLFNDAEVVSAYRCDWDEDVRTDDSRYSRSALEETVPSADQELLDEFESHLHPTDVDEVFEVEASKLLAQALRLEHYDWLSYDYIARDRGDSPDESSDVTEVS